MKSILREKYRYVKFKVHSAKEYGRQDFEKQLRQSLLDLMGEMQYSRCLPKLVAYSGTEGIIKILRDTEKETRAALALIARFDSIPIHLQSIFVSGTIKGCKEGGKSKKG